MSITDSHSRCVTAEGTDVDHSVPEFDERPSEKCCGLSTES